MSCAVGTVFILMKKEKASSWAVPVLPVIWFATVSGVSALCSVLFSPCLITIVDELQIHGSKTNLDKHSRSLFTWCFLFHEHRDFQVREINAIIYSVILTLWLECCILWERGRNRLEFRGFHGKYTQYLISRLCVYQEHGEVWRREYFVPTWLTVLVIKS